MHLFIRDPARPRRRERASRRRRRCGFSSSRSSTKCCAARWATRSARDARPNCSSRRSAARPSEPQRDDDPGCARRRDRRQPLVSRAAGALAQPDGACRLEPCEPRIEPGRTRSNPSNPAEPGRTLQNRWNPVVDPPDDSARAVPRHLHHRDRRRGDCDHRSARRARARAVRAGDGEADRRAGSEPAAADADADRAVAGASARRCIPHAATLERFGLEIEEFGGDSVRLSAVPARARSRGVRGCRPRAGRAISRASIAARASRTPFAGSPRRWRAMPP